MAVELMNFPNMEDQKVIQEAASQGLQSMEHLIRFLFHQQQQSNKPIGPRRLYGHHRSHRLQVQESYLPPQSDRPRPVPTRSGSAVSLPCFSPLVFTNTQLSFGSKILLQLRRRLQ
ncbi:hypothetical protein ACFX13_013059 [Malus domestica]